MFRANKPGCGNDGGRRGRQQQCNSPKSCFHRDIKLPQKKEHKVCFLMEKEQMTNKRIPNAGSVSLDSRFLREVRVLPDKLSDEVEVEGEVDHRDDE